MPEVALTRRDPLGMITLRCDLADPRLAVALGFAVPERRRIAFGGGGAAAWMAPDELMLFVPAETAAARREGLEAGLARVHCLVADVSDARAVFRLAGPGARAVLARGAPVDLGPGVFGVGDFRRTRLGQVAAAIWAPEADALELMCFRSVAGFVADWLENAARSVRSG